MKVGVKQRVREGEKPKPTRYYSDKQEKTIVKENGGKQTISSGSTPFSKGDVLLDEWLLEAKTKTSHSDSISVKKEWIEKNKKEALFMGKKYQAVVFNFGPEEDNYYIIDKYIFQELLELLKKKEEE